MTHTKGVGRPQPSTKPPGRLGRIRATHDRRPAPAAGSPLSYDRRTELPRVLPLWPHELDDETPQGRSKVLAKLRRALRAERRRGIAGHWTYDLARHVELLRVYRRELASSGLPDPTQRTHEPTTHPSSRPSDCARTIAPSRDLQVPSAWGRSRTASAKGLGFRDDG